MKLQKTFCFIAYALMGVVLVFGQDLPGKDTDVVSLISLSGVDCRRTYDSFGDTGICVAICCGVLREPRSLNTAIAELLARIQATIWTSSEFTCRTDP